jgi:hypothetical protein
VTTRFQTSVSNPRTGFVLFALLAVFLFPGVGGAGNGKGQKAPTSTALPTISGSAVVGQKLTASTGSWSGGVSSYAYQWLRCDSSGNSCAPLAGAASSSYGPVAGDVGATLRVSVTASNKVGSSTATSNATSVVAPAPLATAPANTALPAISGSAVSGQTLTASTGTWSSTPTSYGYQWRRCDSAGGTCSNLSGATAASYAAANGDVGFTLRVAVTATNAVGSTTAVSNQTALVAAAATAPANTALPTISGSAVAGQTLAASAGTWSWAPTSYGYQWRRCDSAGGACTTISGATTASYAVASGDVGSTLRVAVSATNAVGSTTAVSNQTALVAAGSGSGTSYPASFYDGPAGAGNVVPASGAALGLWTDGSWTTMEQNFLNEETALGRKLDVYHLHYGAPTGTCYAQAPFSQGIESWAWARGVYSFLTWSPGYTIAQVNSGAYDSCFRDVAQRFAAFGHPVWLRLWWEFNGTWTTWKYDPTNPQPFIDAWQRVVNIFKSAGATNTMFVWTPSEGYYDPAKTLFQNGYPGDAYVDWVASDRYNWNKSTAWCSQFHAGWCDFWEMFHHGYTGTQAKGVEVTFRNRKPYAIPEVGSLEDPLDATHKGQWMQNMEASIKSDFPDLKMLLYSDVNLTTSEGVNWRIDTSTASLNGFKQLAQDPYFHMG